MAITSAATRKAGPYICNGVTVAFPFNFKIFTAADLVVTQTDTTGVESNVTSGFTVALNANQDANPGGTLTMTVAPVVGLLITLTSQVANTQPMVLTNNGGFFATVLNDMADRCVMLVQQVTEKLNRTLSFPVSDASVGAQLPGSAARANTVLAFDASGAPLAGPSIVSVGTVAGNVASIITTAANIGSVNTTAANIGNVNAVAGSIANVNAVAGNAANINAAVANSANINAAPAAAALAQAEAVITTSDRIAVEAAIAGAGGGVVSNANSVLYMPAGTGAIARTAQEKHRETVSVTDFGAVGNGIVDDTVAVQAAINTGKAVRVIGTCKVNNLTMSTVGQIIFANGDGVLVKGASGPIITITGDNCQIDVVCRGESSTPAFTGDNIVINSNNVHVKKDSYWAFGRAVKCIGSHCIIHAGLYQTADATATGYDIELGVSGIATLYHEVKGAYSSQHTGGILLIDTGVATISGGQIGKLTIASGTNPAGIGGPRVRGVRITGDVSVGVSNTLFANNMFSNINIAFLLGSSSCSLDASNNTSAVISITNSGNVNNYIAREVSSGGSSKFKQGHDSSLDVVTTDYATGDKIFPGNVTQGLGKAYKMQNAAGVVVGSAAMSGDNLTIAALGATNGLSVATAGGSLYAYAGGAGTFYLGSAGAYRVTIDTNGYLKPFVDNTYDLGTAAMRWRTVYAGTGTINTSDERVKQQWSIDVAPELRAWARVNFGKFKFNDAVAGKGEKARWHFGLIAQQVKAAFEAEGLDAFAYGLLCYDEWDGSEAFEDENGVTHESVQPGNRYGIRYEEALALECAYLRSRL